MKIQRNSFAEEGTGRTGRAVAPRGPRESGMVTVIFIALLAIMMTLVMVETSSLIRLRREVKLMEQQQLKRLNGPQTNSVAATTAFTK